MSSLASLTFSEGQPLRIEFAFLSGDPVEPIEI